MAPTKLPRPNCSRALRLLLCVASIVSYAALPAVASAKTGLAPTEWAHQQTLDVAAPGLVRVTPTAATFDAAGPQQADLRILDANGTELAYLLDRPPIPTPQIIRPASFAVKLESGATVITLTTGTAGKLRSVALETPRPFFLKAARVELSADQRQWTTLDEGVPLFRQWGAEKLEFNLGERSAAYVRLTINDQRSAAIPFTGASLAVAAAPAPALVPLGAQITRRDEFAGETVLTLALDGRHAPLAALRLETKEPLFMRRVTVAVREVRDAVPGERVVASGTVYRVALDGAAARDELSVPLAFTPDTRELLVHIHNGDSPPLAIDAVQVQRHPVGLLFRAPTAGTYTLLSGNAQATAPRYDLAAFAGELRRADATTITPGPLTDTPNYRPRESLAAAPLPDVPLTGAPLDAKDWPFRRAITLKQPGVQELELDPVALAQAQTGFADLRLLRADHQIPYVLEQPALARSLSLTPAATPDAKRPAVSVWQLTLPQSRLPLRRLGLTSATPLFERQFRIYEKLTDANGHGYEITLASGAWSRTPEPGVPETRVFDLTARPSTASLWIETDNGDNPAIALGAVQAVYPVVRLIFKVAETDGLTLAYGNPNAATPRYDLRLVAQKLLTAPRQVAQLAAAGENSATAKPFAGLNAGYLFWAVLALVVVVLFIIVAKLLPKPPAA